MSSVKTYLTTWAIWFAVVAVATSALWFMLLETDVTGLPSAMWRLAVAGAVVAPICDLVTRKRSTDAAIWLGFLVGATCMALIGAVIFAMTTDPEGRALLTVVFAFEAVFSGVGGALIGIFNVRKART